MFKKLLPFFKGLLRHSLSLVGGVLVMTGILNESQSIEIVGYFTALVATIQSVSSTTKETFVQQFQGAIRHILTFLGGVGFLKGWFSSELFMELAASASTIIGIVWSFMAKKDLPPITPTTPES